MARHTPECDRMIAVFEGAKLPLYVAYYRRALPRFSEVMNLLTSGSIGRVTGVTHRLAAPHHCGGESWRVDGEPREAGTSSTWDRTCWICLISFSGRSGACGAARQMFPRALRLRTRW